MRRNIIIVTCAAAPAPAAEAYSSLPVSGATTSRRWRRSVTPPNTTTTTTTTADYYNSRTSPCWTAALSAPFTGRCCRPAAVAGRRAPWPSSAFGRRAAAVTNWTCTDGYSTRTSSDCCSTFIPVTNEMCVERTCTIHRKVCARRHFIYIHCTVTRASRPFVYFEADSRNCTKCTAPI